MKPQSKTKWILIKGNGAEQELPEWQILLWSKDLMWNAGVGPLSSRVSWKMKKKNNYSDQIFPQAMSSMVPLISAL